MLKKDCHHDCNLSHCPFTQDTRNSNRYVCLKCGVERDIDQNRSGLFSFLLLILALFISFLVLVDAEKQDREYQQQQSAHNSPSELDLH
ncbi:MAG: hypothetical protein KME23_00620 [Goleter apudmare HA4340-LM2]|nr:hypothetical protein [Goleter apudmare HA4340-LM2]